MGKIGTAYQGWEFGGGGVVSFGTNDCGAGGVGPGLRLPLTIRKALPTVASPLRTSFARRAGDKSPEGAPGATADVLEDRAG
jgi:hypothetical protein